MGDYDLGLALLRQFGGVDQPAVLELFDSVGAADFGAEAVSFVYGGVYYRPGLSLRHRQIVTVGALAALGFAAAQLRFHVTAARNVGCSAGELREALDLVAAATDSQAATSMVETTAAGPESDADGSTLDGRGRDLVLLAAYTATGGVAPRLRDHLRELLDDGAGQEAVETILHTAIYAGFPAALNALAVAREVFAEWSGAAGGVDVRDGKRAGDAVPAWPDGDAVEGT
jgi:4-carboxymuconolactone decarboxylase